MRNREKSGRSKKYCPECGGHTERYLSVQTAAAIINVRDNINALFHQRYDVKLLLLHEERDLIQFSHPAKTREEFVYRVCALANVATNLNIDCLRQLTGNTDSHDKSITLLEQYLQQENRLDIAIINTFRNINRLRQGYPVHSDCSRGVLDAHTHFGFDYPIVDHTAAWLILLDHYLDALTNLLEKLKE